MIIASYGPVYAQTVDQSVDNVCEERGFSAGAEIRAVSISKWVVDNFENPLNTRCAVRNVCSRQFCWW